MFLPFGTDMKIAVMLMTLATLATFHASAIARSSGLFEDNELNYLGFILQKILFFVFILVMLHFKTGLVGFVVAHLVSNYSCGPSTTSSFPEFYTKVKLQVDLPLWKELFFSAVPMGGGVMLRQLAFILIFLCWD